MANRIRELRNQKGVSLRKMAATLGVSPSTLNTWENEVYLPSLPHLIEMADYFDVTIDYLVGRPVDRKRVFREAFRDISPTRLAELLEQSIDED